MPSHEQFPSSSQVRPNNEKLRRRFGSSWSILAVASDAYGEVTVAWGLAVLEKLLDSILRVGENWECLLHRSLRL